MPIHTFFLIFSVNFPMPARFRARDFPGFVLNQCHEKSMVFYAVMDDVGHKDGANVIIGMFVPL